jgi:hypothetical protein
MSGGSIDIDEIKRKLRRLKRLEIKIRFGYNECYEHRGSQQDKPYSAKLVWDEFFELHDTTLKRASYYIKELALMNKESFKNVINEYFFNVYYRYYKENGMINIPVFDPEILSQMGLSPDAGGDDIKKKFRELAKKYHPDTGGDSIKFIELMNNYKKLVE